MTKSSKKAKGGQTKTDPPSSSSSGKAKTDRKAKGEIAQGSMGYSSNGKVKHKTGQPANEVLLSVLSQSDVLVHQKRMLAVCCYPLLIGSCTGVSLVSSNLVLQSLTEQCGKQEESQDHWYQRHVR